MKADTLNWFRIVKSYSALAKLTYRPTLPFIVGAIRDPVGEAPDTRAAAQVELHSLLKKMHDAPVGSGVHIQWCPGARAAARRGILFSHVHIQWCPGTVAHVVVAMGHSVKSLTWNPSEFKEAVDVDALFGKLWACYGDRIFDGKYSKNGNWHGFTPTEFKNIRKAIGIV